MDIYLITILIGIVLTLIVFFNFYSKYNKESNIIFYNNEETKQFLQNDEDKYISRLTKYDLIARKSKDHKSYILNISECATSFTNIQKQKVKNCADKADQFLSKFKWNGLECSAISKISWKFALTSRVNHFEYEDGLPHTRKDIIFLTENTLNSNEHHLINILIHEKIHIFQRMNRTIMKNMVQEMGFVVFTQTPQHTVKLRRSNPDINDQIYYDTNSGSVYFCKYSSENPSNISDVDLNYVSTEHPYEKMAYEIAGEYTRQIMNEKKI